MPRQRRLRKVVAPPSFKSYYPTGSGSLQKEAIDLFYEEYEAIKLADYDLLNHQEASRLMGVSRPTFARIYESARRKIATALVETREIKSVYGNAWFDKDWLICNACHVRFTIPKVLKEHVCPICKSTKIEALKKSV